MHLFYKNVTFERKYKSSLYQLQKFKFESQRDEFKILDQIYKMKIAIMIACTFNGIGVHQIDHIIG